MAQAEVIIAGAGLAAAVTALRLAADADRPRVLLLEAADAPFAGHTWSFHHADIGAGARRWLSPAIAHRWGGQEVRFPAFTRRLDSGYASITAASLGAAVAAAPHVTLRPRAPVAALDAGGVTLGDGTRIEAPCVIDARGLVPDPALMAGFQKFLGQEVELESPHGLDVPVIMDATVAQLDGYRFVYLLPFSPTRLLIEDTRYSDAGTLNRDDLRAAIAAYAGTKGWRIARVVREEEGALPITLGFDAPAFWSRAPRDVPRIGLRAARFHPVTGYSLPDAVISADLVAQGWRAGSATLARTLREDALVRARGQGFYRLLNRMLFQAAEPDERWRILQRFYRLPEPLIARFYAGATTRADMARILIGRPPVPISRALRCLSDPAQMERSHA